MTKAPVVTERQLAFFKANPKAFLMNLGFTSEEAENALSNPFAQKLLNKCPEAFIQNLMVN